MTAGPAASRRVGINGRTSPPPDSSLPEVCSFQLPKVCSFRLPLTGCTQYVAREDLQQESEEQRGEHCRCHALGGFYDLSPCSTHRFAPLKAVATPRADVTLHFIGDATLYSSKSSCPH